MKIRLSDKLRDLSQRLTYIASQIERSPASVLGLFGSPAQLHTDMAKIADELAAIALQLES